MLANKVIIENLKYSAFIFFTIVSCCSFSQSDTIGIYYSKKITPQAAKEYLSILASDSLEGRETGERGQKMAAHYIAKKFNEFGLKPILPAKFSDWSKCNTPASDTNEFFRNCVPEQYYQKYPMMIQSKRAVKMTNSKGKAYQNTDYFSFYGLSPQTFKSTIVFAGHGIKENNYNDFKYTTVKDKIVMILDGEPFLKDSVSPITKLKGKTHWSTNFRMKEELARKAGAKALFIITDDFLNQYEKNKHKINHTSVRLFSDSVSSIGIEKKIPVVFISRKCADWLLGVDKTSVKKAQKSFSKNKPFESHNEIQLEVTVDEKGLLAENVVGLIEGSDSPNEYIIVSAHYDHLGVSDGKVFNGADDDGSGTVAMMNMAKAFAEAKKKGHGPKRSIVFIAFSGEEKGLLGSEYYTNHPVFPLENTIANLNIDMIGRIDPNHKEDTNYVYIIGSDKLSTELHTINECSNRHVGLKLDYTYNLTNDPNRFYYRSDHYNFAKNNIPVIFYFNGVHADYHKETDEISKINFELLARRNKLVFFTAWELANRKNRIVVDVKPEKE